MACIVCGAGAEEGPRFRTCVCGYDRVHVACLGKWAPSLCPNCKQPTLSRSAYIRACVFSQRWIPPVLAFLTVVALWMLCTLGMFVCVPPDQISNVLIILEHTEPSFGLYALQGLLMMGLVSCFCSVVVLIVYTCTGRFGSGGPPGGPGPVAPDVFCVCQPGGDPRGMIAAVFIMCVAVGIFFVHYEVYRLLECARRENLMALLQAI